MDKSEIEIMNNTFNKLFTKALKKDNKSFDKYMKMPNCRYVVKSTNELTKTSCVYIFQNDTFADMLEVSTSKINTKQL